MRNSQAIAITLSSFFAWSSIVVDAQEITIGDLATVQSQTVLFRAEAERNKARRVRDAESGASLVSIPSEPLQMSSPRPAAVAEIPTPAGELPVVRSVWGSGKHLRATLAWGSAEIDVNVNSTVPGGYIVASISLDRVVLKHENTLYPLLFSQGQRAQLPVALPGR